MTTLKTSPIAMNCSGCGVEGQGAMRQYLANPDRRTGVRPIRHFNDHPPDWSLRFVGKERLDFCFDCRAGLASGKLRLVGNTVVEN